MLQIWISIAGLIIAAIGLPLLYFQIRGIQRTLHSTTHAAIYEQAADFRAYLIRYPYLRKYFFDKVKIESDHEEYNRVLSIAEVYLNYLEHIAVLENNFGSKNRPALNRFIKNTLARSPVLRQHLAENQALYSDALNRFLET